MKAYKIEIMVVDLDEIGEEKIKSLIEHTRYTGRCMRPEVMKIETRDIGEWHDDHPLNLKNATKAEYERLFAPNRIYHLLLKPGDYTRCDVETYRTKEEAETARTESGHANSHYWTIIPIELE